MIQIGGVQLAMSHRAARKTVTVFSVLVFLLSMLLNTSNVASDSGKHNGNTKL